MGFGDVMHTWSNINCILGSTVNYAQQRQFGVNPQFAATNLGLNLINGIARNEVAHEMYKTTGNPLGYGVNATLGYTNPINNALATTTLLNMNMPPMMFWGMFNPIPMNYSIMSMGMPFISGYSFLC